jgi:hypothetical protein
LNNIQDEQSVASLGIALKSNPANVLQILDLSGCRINPETLPVLLSGLVAVGHAIPVINLSNCAINAKGK